MRSGMNKDEFFVKMKRKPAQEELYQKALAGTLTDTDIEQSGQPLWVRDALTQLKTRSGLSWSAYATKRANEMIVEDHPAKIFPVFRWDGQELEFKPTRGFSYDIRHNEYVLVDTTALQVKIDFTVLNVSQQQILDLIAGSTFIGDYTEPDYIEVVAQRRQRE